MLTIWKYPLIITKFQSIYIPLGAEPLYTQIQDNTVCVWFRVNNMNHPTFRKIWIYGTGADCDSTFGQDYIGTVQLDNYVWHIFCEREKDQ